MKRKYKELFNAIQIGDLVLFENKLNIFSKIIGWLGNFGNDTKRYGIVSHASVFVGTPSNFIAEYTMFKGFSFTPIEKYCDGKHRIIVRRYNYITEELKRDLVREVFKDWRKKEDNQYNWLGLLGIVYAKIFNRKRDKDNIFSGENRGEFCSSGSSEWYDNIGIKAFPHIGKNMITPIDELYTDKFNTIIEIE